MTTKNTSITCNQAVITRDYQPYLFREDVLKDAAETLDLRCP